MSTSELPLKEMIAVLGNSAGRAGQEVRIFDVPADAGSGMGIVEDLHGHPSSFAFVEMLSKQTQRYYGTAGPAWIELLVKNRTQITREIENRMGEFMKPLLDMQTGKKAHAQILRVAKSFALYAAVGEIAIANGLFPWAEGAAKQGVQQCFDDWIQNRGGYEQSEAMRIVGAVRRFIEEQESRFSTDELTGEYKRIINRRAGFKMMEGHETLYYFHPDVFLGEVCGNFNHRTVCRVLDTRGFLAATDRSDKKGRDYQVQKTFTEIGSKARYYCIRSKVLMAGFDEGAMTAKESAVAAHAESEVAKSQSISWREEATFADDVIGNL